MPKYIQESSVLNEFAGSEDIFVELKAVFFAELPKMLSAVEESVKSHDAGALERSAHTLKGAVSNFYCPEIREAAFKLEKIGREKIMDDAPSRWVELKTLMDEFVIELTDFTLKGK